ncbi:MAG: T9SS type A sorting domain-containing protein [Candidatus Marinimicrobia bacterium]|nr:T9SS type A sorting domain-containing protein [Candidatus Neomarinimicrobiota bacterium]
MKSMITVKFPAYVAVLAMLSVGTVTAQVGGPYTTDANTMLLLHFDGDLSNASDSSADGEYHGRALNFFYLDNPFDVALGKALRIDNGSKLDTAYITVPDTSHLDLTGDWTIEGWMAIFTFGEGSGDWRWVPRLVIKTGDEVFWRPNYFVELWGDNRLFSCGYQANSQDAWPQANTPNNVFVPGEWVHLAFIRDTTRHILLTLVHNDAQELINFSVADYLDFGAADPTPITTDQPVYIGYAGGGYDSFLDGFVDEIRISNVVREFPIPPIVAGVTALPNQDASVAGYAIGADIYTLFASTSIASAKLYYSVDDTATWSSVDMTTVSGDSMSATIPQQPTGTIIAYYIEAIDDQGKKYAYPQDAGYEPAAFLQFGIYTPATQTLDLAFDEGTGTPADASTYGHTVTEVGAPAYTTDAIVGDNAIYLEGDSSYLEVDSPFLTSDTFAVDFWFKMDTIKTYCRILNRPGSPSSWSTNCYQVRTNNAQQLQAISDGGAFSFTTNGTIEPDKWYRVIYEVREAAASDTMLYYGIFQLSDADGVLFQDYAGSKKAVLASMSPLRIGKAGTATGPDAYPPFFKGSFDEVKIYNYPAVGLDTTKVAMELSTSPVEGPVPTEYALKQNYPNPFNPVTNITYALPQSERVVLSIYNLLGRRVVDLVNEVQPAGAYTVQWDAKDRSGRSLATGIYFYHLTAGNFVMIKKMVLIK